EHGRGFAVVADEVRGLAQRTATSTREIEDIIQAVETGTDQAVARMNQSRDNANETLSIGQEAGSALQAISGLITRINDRNTASASAAEQQATVAKEVDKNLITLRDLSTQSASGASQTSSASTELARLAEGLNKLVSRFTL
ncbi:MAG: methyl-accepting chemotaxis protein, partial [Natronospirillum sp.]